jgi:hypothetical protein
MVTDTISYDAKKMRELLLLVAERSVDDPNFGKTKLNKILYYIDFEAYGRFGRAVTGAEYQRRPYGPVPREITEARQELVLHGDARVETTNRFGYPQGRLIAQRPAHTSVFSAEELELVGDVIAGLWHMTGAAVSEKSHREPGWKIAEDGGTIPYGTVFLDSRRLTDDDIRRGQELHRLYGSSCQSHDLDQAVSSSRPGA